MSVLIALLLLGVALIPDTSLTSRITAHLTTAVPAANTTSLASYAPTPVPVVAATDTTAVTATNAAVPTGPALGAASYYAIDVATGQPLAAKAADTQRPIASITKLVTALVIVRDHPLNQLVTLPTMPTYQPDDETIGLHTGEQLTIRDLLSALLINSADDSADALALVDSGTQAAFVRKMNQVVASWGITGAHFSNPSGLVDTGNGASATALAQIGLLALRNPTIKQLVDTPSATITDRAGHGIHLATTDQLLQNGQFQGIKTGYTGAAGQCFLGLTTVQGHQVITVVLGSQDRFGDTTNLVNWITQTYRWHTPWQPPQL